MLFASGDAVMIDDGGIWDGVRRLDTVLDVHMGVCGLRIGRGMHAQYPICFATACGNLLNLFSFQSDSSKHILFFNQMDNSLIPLLYLFPSRYVKGSPTLNVRISQSHTHAPKQEKKKKKKE